MQSYTRHPRFREAGATLIELMTALAIGMFLMIGAVTVFMQSRATFRVTESLARLQENARFALDAMEPDIRMAYHYGLTNVAANIDGRAPATGIAPTTCGNHWVNDFERGIAATNGGATWPWGARCAGTSPVATADTLLVRRASEDPVTPAVGGIYLQTNRSARSQLFAGATLPSAPELATSQTFRVIANGYYVSSASVAGHAVPSLRMYTLEPDGVIRDRELVSGVEDLQVQLGLDTTLPDAPNASTDRGVIDRWVDPGDALLNNPGFRADERLILAVRIWLRVRAERAERGFVDPNTYTYADHTFSPPVDGLRRFVLSKTIYLRNNNLR